MSVRLPTRVQQDIQRQLQNLRAGSPRDYPNAVEMRDWWVEFKHPGSTRKVIRNNFRMRRD